MKGNWKGGATNAPFFEGYEMESDSLITIKYYEDASLSKVTALGKVVLEGNSIYHVYGRSKWKLVKRTENTWWFEPVENANNSFKWIFVGPDSWKAELITAARTDNYLLERIK